MFRIVGVAALFLTALAVGFWRGVTFESNHRCEVGVGEEMEIVGAVLDVKRSSFNQRLKISTEKEWPSAVYVYADPLPIINSGEKVGVSGKPVAVSWNRESARAQGVCFEIRKAEVKQLGKAQGVSAALSRIGVSLANTIGRVIPSPYGEISAAMLLGRGEDLPSELSEDARRAGISHALVLSGFNISMAVAFAAFVVSFLPRTLKIFIAVAVGISLAGISGFGASAIRAAFGAGAAGFCTWRYRDADPLTALLIALLIMSWKNPLSLAYSLSLQLSALATLGVVAFSERFATLPIIRLIPETAGLREAAASTIAAELLIFPLIAWKIGLLPVLGLPANIISGPAISVSMLAALVAIPLRFIEFTPLVIASLLSLPARWFSSVASYVADFSFASISISLTTAQAILLLIVVISSALASIYFERRRQRENDAPLIERLQIAIKETEKPSTCFVEDRPALLAG